MKTTPTKRRAWRAAPDPLNVTHAGFRTPHSTLRTCIVLCTLSVLCGLAVPVYADSIALIVGIDNYQSYGKLRTCRADALAMRKVLVRRCGFSERRVVLLVDDAPEPTNQPTYATLRGRIRQVTTLAGRDDELLIFFSGHGETLGNEGYLIPMNGSRDDTGTLIPLSWLNDRIRESKARTRMLILDACHAGSGSKGIGGVAPSVPRPAQTVILLSCSAKQQSYPDSAKGVSVFTRFLVEGLAGAADADRNRRVTQVEIYEHVRKAMVEWCLQTGKTQTPLLVGDTRTELTLAQITGGGTFNPFDESHEPVPSWAKVGDLQLRKVTELGLPVAKEVDMGGGVRLKMVLIPPGEFMMGSPDHEKDRDDDESPRHRVRIEQPFYMGIHEVTVDQFRHFVEQSGHRTDAEKGDGSFGWTGEGWKKSKELDWRNPGFKQAGSHPVVCVSWNDAAAFCHWLSGRSSGSFRLATEAEWEYACRARIDGRFWWGENETSAGRYANVADQTAKRQFQKWTTFDTNDSYLFTAPAGNYFPNAFGLYDMIGNVREWCQSIYQPYPYDARDGRESLAGDDWRVLRGGSWGNSQWGCRSANRLGFAPTDSYSFVGFRVVSSPER